MTQHDNSLEEKVSKLEIEIAERRPIDKLIQLLMYFLAAISLVVGIFGFRQFSDIGNMIAAEVKMQFPRDQHSYLEYKKLIEDTQQLQGEYKALFGKYDQALKNFSHLDKVTDDFDIEGKIGRLIAQVEEEKKTPSLLMEEKWRLGAVATLKLLVEAQKKRNFNSDFIFNAAQTASKLKLNFIAYELMQAAYSKRPNDAPIKAGRLSAIVDIGDEKEVASAFNELMEMVINLDSNSPHIVLSEAWNAAEHLRRYEDLIATIDKFLANTNRPIKPSYAYFLKAYALTRASRPGDLNAARGVMEEGLKKLDAESPNSVWFDASLKQYMQCEEVMQKTNAVKDIRKVIQMMSNPAVQGTLRDKAAQRP